MEYTVNKLSKMSGISARTLRYYDEIGLLKPAAVAFSGYRLYGQAEVDALQQILFYRELGFALDDIKDILQDPGFDRLAAFKNHLTELANKRERLDVLISNVTKSMAAMRGEMEMMDKEKFEGFKQSLVSENEKKYGAEIREKYGDESVDASNANLMGLTQQQFDAAERLRIAHEGKLRAAFENGDVGGDLAREACDLHKQWLCIFYPAYSPEYHKGLGEMYVADERFKAVYDAIAPGCAEFFRDAINLYCSRL